MRFNRSLVCILASLLVLVVAVWYAMHRRGADPGETTISDDGASGIVTTVTGTNFLSNPENMDPDVDGWPSEAFAERAAKSLGRLKKELLAENRDLTEFFTPGFSTLIDSQPPQDVFQNATVVVTQSVGEPKQRREGAEAIHEFIRVITSSERPDRVSIKVVGVQLHSDSATTVLRVESSRSDESGARQTNSRWNCIWTLGEKLKIASAELERLESVRPHRLAVVWRRHVGGHRQFRCVSTAVSTRPAVLAGANRDRSRNELLFEARTGRC